jgi:hypothetical protein
MPENQPTKRKMSVGSYAATTKPLVQGKASNQSQADLEAMRAQGANQGAALRKVVPVGNQSYEEFQRTRKTPQGQAEKEAYERTNKLPRLTDADYQERRFKEGGTQLRQRAVAQPGSSVFDETARDAAYAAQRDRNVRLGNYADTGSKAVTAESLADRSSKMPVQSTYAAPGMALGRLDKDMGDSAPLMPKTKPAAGLAMAKYKSGAKHLVAAAADAAPKKRKMKASPRKA